MSRDRYTEKDENGKWTVRLSENCQMNIECSEVVNNDGSKTCTPVFVYAPFVDQLAEYENLIFSPGTLMAIIKEWKEWADAKNDGRLQVFPKKLYMLVRPCIPGLGGCPLYGGDGTFRCKVDGERKCGPFVCEVTYCDFMRHKIGDVYFTTEEEAKKALEERYGK